jgi:hypothetical protein
MKNKLFVSIGRKGFSSLPEAIALAAAEDYAILAINCQPSSESVLSAELSSLGVFDEVSFTGLLNSVNPSEILSALSGAIGESLNRRRTLIFADFAGLLQESMDLAQTVRNIAAYGRKTGIALMLQSAEPLPDSISMHLSSVA